MKRSPTLFVMILALSLPLASAASGPPPLSDAERVLESYLKKENLDTAKIAAFDHVERTWTILWWDGSCLKRQEEPTEKPEVSLRAGEKLKTFVINTNPLVFTVDRTATAEAAIDSIANLQKLAAGLGSVAGVTVRVRNDDALAKAFGPFEAKGPSRNKCVSRTSDHLRW